MRERSETPRIIAIALVLIALFAGTSPLEIASSLALAAALLWGDRSRWPLLPPLLAFTAAWMASAAPDGLLGLHAAIGKSWPWVMVLGMPILVGDGLSERGLALLERIGLGAAAAAGLWGSLEGLSGPADGPFSHHLTLGYALLIPLARAVHVGAWPAAAAMAAGVLATRATGPLLSMAVVLAALRVPPAAALGGGLAAALGIIAGLQGDDELTQRGVLWATGGGLATQHPLGVGPGNFRDVAAVLQDALVPGFHFPLHAHDAALQVAALAGPGVWIAWVWLGLALWRRAPRPGRAGLVALLVGGLTQDTLGDLEVVRGLTVWALLPLTGERTAIAARCPQSEPPTEEP